MELPEDILEVIKKLTDPVVALPPKGTQVFALVLKQLTFESPDDNPGHSFWKEDVYAEKLIIGWAKLQCPFPSAEEFKKIKESEACQKENQ